MAKRAISFDIRKGGRVYRVEHMDVDRLNNEDLSLEGCIVALHIASKRQDRENRALERRIAALEAQLKK